MATATTKRRSSATARKSTGRKQASGTKASTKAKPAAKPKAASRAPKAGNIDPRDLETQRKVAELRSNGKSWTEVAAALKTTLGNKGRLELAYFYSTVKPKDRIRGTEDEISVKIVEAREAKQPWGLIAARCDMAEGAVRKLFEAASGSSAKGQNVAQLRKAEREGSKPAAKKSTRKGQTAGQRTATKAKRSTAKAAPDPQ